MAGQDKNEVWNEVLESVKVSVSPAIFSTWLSQTHLVSLKKQGAKKYMAEIGCSSSFVKSTIEERYFGLIQDSLIKNLDSPCDLMFVIKQLPQANKNLPLPSPLFDQKDISEDLIKKLEIANLRPGFTFENFAVSSSNQMAWAAAEAVAQKPGIAYNPLFVWGGVGVGKTHLMNAIGTNIIKQEFGSKVLCCTAEEFTNDIIEGIRNKTTQSFRNKYRKLKVLMIDDIQFIAGKDAVQDEFFHTFNAVTAAGGQVLLTSDRPPTEIAKLAERLRSRFEAGLIVDISPPDFELRCAIIQIKSKEKGVEIPADLVQMIAGNIETARRLEGFITRLVSESRMKNSPITEAMITSLMGRGHEGNGHAQKLDNPNKVIEAVSSHFSVSKRALLGQARAKIIARPRQILMYLLRTEMGLPLQEVGRIVGRDHSTVIHAVDRVSFLASTNVQIREDLLGIKNDLYGKL